MSLLSDIWTYWKGNANLNTTFPINPPTGQTKYWVGYIGDGTKLPFVSANLISAVPTWSTCGKYFDEATVQFSVFADTLASAESYADLIQRQFDFVSIGSSEQPARRNNRFAISDPAGAYHIVLEYLFMVNGNIT